MRTTIFTSMYFAFACIEAALAVDHYYNGDTYWLGIIAAVLFYACGVLSVINSRK